MGPKTLRLCIYLLSANVLGVVMFHQSASVVTENIAVPLCLLFRYLPKLHSLEKFDFFDSLHV